MSDHWINSAVTVAIAIVGIAILAVIVSQKSQTANVITAAGAAFANDISAAVAPVTGATAQINTGGSGLFSGGFAPSGISLQ